MQKIVGTVIYIPHFG